MSRALARSVKECGDDYDLIIGIANGGLPTALILSDELGVGMEIMRASSYTGIGERKRPRIGYTLTKDIRGMRILLVDDLVDHGDTMNAVVRRLNSKKPARISTAVLFRKPWSRFSPDFCIKSTDKWVVFPWNTAETRRGLGRKRRLHSHSTVPGGLSVMS